MFYEIASRIELLIERDKLDLAQQQLNDALSQYPDAGVLHQLQSEVYYKGKDFKNSLEAIERAIGCEPDDDYVYYLKSRIHIARNENKKAEGDIDTAIQLNPERADYYGVKASIRLDENHPKEAVVLATKGLSIDPDSVLCNNVLSMSHSKMGHKEDALDRINHLLENDPQNPFTHANAGMHYLRLRNIQKAKEHFSVALEIDPNLEYAKSGMAEAIKSTNFLYRKLLQFAFWIDKIGSKNKWIMYIGILILIRLVPFLVPFYLIFILWTWFTPPIANILLYFDKYGRYLLDQEERLLTKINMMLVSLAIISSVTGIFLGIEFLGLGFAFFITTLPVYHLSSEQRKLKRNMLIGFASLFILVGAAAWFTGYILGLEQSTLLWGTLIGLTVLFTWVR